MPQQPEPTHFSPPLPRPTRCPRDGPNLRWSALSTGERGRHDYRARSFAIDPALVERGTRRHAATQNRLAAFLATKGLTPRAPRPGEPNFDLAWVQSGV